MDIINNGMDQDSQYLGEQTKTELNINNHSPNTYESDDLNASTNINTNRNNSMSNNKNKKMKTKKKHKNTVIADNTQRCLCCQKIAMLIIGISLITCALYWVYSSGSLNICLVQHHQDYQLQCMPSQPIPQHSHSPTPQPLTHSLARNPSSIQKSLIQPSKKHKPTPQALFAFKLHQNPNNNTYLAAEYEYYNTKYQIGQYKDKQLPFCVVCTGRNLQFQQRYVGFLKSLLRQQYENYVVVVVDDASTDNTVALMKQKLGEPEYAKIKDKVKIIQNMQRKYALYNRDMAITNYCLQDTIIIQLDSDDELIGSQVFSTINAVYSANSSIWVLYSSYIYWSSTYAQPSQGISSQIPKKILQLGTYRQSTQWYTSALRTFRRQLYMKIDKTDFLDQYKHYYKWTSDLFVHYSLVQMAGMQHYKYIHQIFYFYYRDHNVYDWVEKSISRMHALAIRPYLMLGGLQEQASRKEEVRDMGWVEKEIQKLEKCRYLKHDQECIRDN